MRFLMIDRILSIEPGVKAEGLKNVSLTEDFFTDHFPNYPVMPGVLIVESMAHLSALLLEETLELRGGGAVGVKPALSIIKNAKFRTFVRPGDQLLLESKLLSEGEQGAEVSVKARVGEKIVARAVLDFIYIEMGVLFTQEDQEKFDRLVSTLREDVGEDRG